LLNTVLKFLYDKFWYPFFGKILSNFVFLIEGDSKNKKNRRNNTKNMKN